MRIYQAEKDAGINIQISKAGNSTFVTAQVRVGDIEKYFDGISVADLIKANNTVQTVKELLGQEQPDLALVVAILVSTGWNLNDDIFVPEEVWKARLSPVHKPMNDNHNAHKILGHIVQSRALDKSGNEIELSDNEVPPDSFDLEVAGVLYRAFPALSKRIDEIIDKAKSGDMYVSMEAWFPDFSYGFIDPDSGETKLIERTETTAFLTKHLKVYGGTGEYQGYKIGRVLRNIIFGAQGFVDEPANPESVIKVAANKFVNAKLDKLLEGGVEGMNEKDSKGNEVLDQVSPEDIQEKLESKVKEVAKLNKAIKEFEDKDYDGEIAVLTNKVEKLTVNTTEASEKMDAIEIAKNELQKQLDEAIKRADNSEAELDKIRKNTIAQERLGKLLEVKKVEDAEVTLAELHDMTDETFEIVLKYAGEAKSKDEVVIANSSKESNTNKKDEAEQAEAALNNVEEENSADFKITSDDKQKSEADLWVSTAKALCRREDKEEGGD